MARWVNLSGPFDWLGENNRFMVAFPRGEFLMTDGQADAAIASGVGEEMPKPKGKRANAAGQVVDVEPLVKDDS